MELTIQRKQISLWALRSGQRLEVERIADLGEATPIEPSEIRYLPIVRPVGDNGYSLVDGSHRLASMLLAGASRFPVLVVEGPAGWWRDIDADSVIGEHVVLDAIYERALRAKR